jgi:hypothetical protein
MAESGEPVLAVAQSLADEMRRQFDRSSHAHKKPADGNGTITGADSLFLPRGDLKTEESPSRTHMSIRSGSSAGTYSTYPQCDTPVTAASGAIPRLW